MKPWTPPMSAPRSDADGERDEPVYQRSKPRSNVVGDPLGLDHRHRVAEEPEQRPDRQVDVAGHDDQHHARRHDGDRGALDRQVPQVAGGQEVAARQQVEADPDDDQGDDHAEQAQCRSRSTRRSERTLRRVAGRRPRGAGGPPSAGHASSLAASARPAPTSPARGADVIEVGAPSAAGGDGAGLDALAERRLVDPPGVEHDVEVVLGDRAAARAGSRSARCPPAT